ncbi:hypothetical protein [Nocardioides sp. GY 10127]|uniref:hypothetical protein n=1 Tax=Nocardioides sp. GY 10127 TaxID=2569762 RepID=UPI0010A7C134|nr:hypothetical protein [Nocardioides sp. GY 10127]TIC85537.1 hypothetical protein E8D37_02585 [Nocardioides sp. GY 10127]
MNASDVVVSTIAVLALIVSVLAWVQARRSADAAEQAADAASRSAHADEQMTRVEAARHREERRPQWSAGLARRRNGETGPRRLVVELVAPETVEHVTIRSLDDRLTFVDSQEASPNGGDTAEVGTVRRGIDVELRVHTPQPPSGGVAKIELTTNHDGDQWSDICDVKLPPPPPMVYM